MREKDYRLLHGFFFVCLGLGVINSLYSTGIFVFLSLDYKSKEMNTVNNIHFSENLFWDADMNDLNLDVHKTYVVGRVLDYGEWNDWLAIRSYYGMDELKEIALRIRTMFPKSLSFIATMTNTPENRFRCYEQVKNKEKANYFIS